MECVIGIDIGGTKIAGAAYNEKGAEIAQVTLPTPQSYESFLEVCVTIFDQLEQKSGKAKSLGVCAPYWDETTNANIPCLIGKPLQKDLEKHFKLSIPFANDANCAALAEALEGAGKNYSSVFGLIMGTGVGGGFVWNGEILTGKNGMAAEVGHLPLPYYDPKDGELVACGCGQKGCLEKLIAGAALSRLYRAHTNKDANAKQIAELANAKDAGALSVLDHYYTIVAKAMVVILHTFDPDIICVSGGLNVLPGLYEAVSARWGQFAICKKPKTKFVAAHFGSMAGLRGAALLGMGAHK